MVDREELKNSDDYQEIFSHVREMLKEKDASNSKNEIHPVELDLDELKTRFTKTTTSQNSVEHDSKEEPIKPTHPSQQLKKNNDNHLAILSKELDLINTRIQEVSVITSEHEQFREKNMLGNRKDIVIPFDILNLEKRTCDICNNEIELEKNLSGLVVAGEYFACEHCCQQSNHEELTKWTKSRMNNTSDFQPIGLWITRQISRQ